MFLVLEAGHQATWLSILLCSGLLLIVVSLLDRNFLEKHGLRINFI